MTDKVLMRRAISSTFYVVLVFFLLMGISFAWFSKNMKVTATGMSVKAQTSANLVISKSTTFDEFQFSVVMEPTTPKLLPASHCDISQSPSGLLKPADLTDIDYDSGLASTIPTETVPVDDNSKYYIDYTVYISCQGMALTDASLTATMEAQDPSILDKPYLQAASIDFYLGSVNKDGYCGTLNLAGLDIKYNHGACDTAQKKTSIEILPDTVTRIPCLQDQSGDKYLTIIMRCYFDGALQNSVSTTYVTSAALDTTEVKMKVTFIATGTETAPSETQAASN